MSGARVSRAAERDRPNRVIGRDLGTEVTLLLVSIDEIGGGPGLHWHPYDEVFSIQEGRARYTVGDAVIEAGPGDVVFGPAEVPHRFEVIETPFRATDIHLSAEWIQTEVETGD
ncbi:cupin domain-containing protein [Litorisediminicola beolgyonensis]|uniref:Cupin domain-containing protein n=1 Tax=Litorisediminicola beolgyonensis TaxID=1173614 RepID=A0ABW3ZP54_9RHOB